MGKGKKDALVLGNGGALLPKRRKGRRNPELKGGATDQLWEGGATFGAAKLLWSEIQKIFARHNLVIKAVPIEPKKPFDETAARDEGRSHLMKVGGGTFIARRMLASNGDIADHLTRGGLHQAIGIIASPFL